MHEIVESCHLCGSLKSQLFDQRKFRSQLVTNRICKNCGFVFQSPRMTKEDLDVYYLKEYRQSYQGEEGPTEKDFLVQKGRAKHLIEFVKGEIPTVSRCLDIGCSTGTLLEHIRKEFGCQIIGIEPGDSYRNHARRRGISVHPTLETLEVTTIEKIDLICMVHVLEHLPNPIEYLVDLRKLYLSQNGWLLIEVPNLYAHDCFEIAHLYAFSEHSLRELLCKSGFKILKVRKQGEPRSALIPLFITLLVKPTKGEKNIHEGNVEKERGVRLKRYLGLTRRRFLMHLFPRRAWNTLM